MLLLKDRCSDIFCRNKQGANVLHVSVKKGLRHVVQELIKMDYPLNKLKDNGLSALSIGASEGQLEIIRELIDAGADVN